MEKTTESLSKQLNKEIIIIVAYLAKTMGFGFDGGLPWKKIIADMKRFMKETMGHTVIIGRGTFDSLDKKAFKGRQTIVVSKTLDPKKLRRGVLLARTLTDAIRMASREKIFILGGEGLFKEALENDLANTILATIVHADLPFDRVFPPIPRWWKSVEQGNRIIDERSHMTIQFITLKNGRNPFVSVD